MLNAKISVVLEFPLIELWHIAPTYASSWKSKLNKTGQIVEVNFLEKLAYIRFSFIDLSSTSSCQKQVQNLNLTPTKLQKQFTYYRIWQWYEKKWKVQYYKDTGSPTYVFSRGCSYYISSWILVNITYIVSASSTFLFSTGFFESS